MNPIDPKKKEILLLSILAIVFFGYYLSFHFRITDSAIISAIIAALVFILLAGGVYYFAYRWIVPELRDRPFHAWALRGAASGLIGMGISIWFVQNTALPARLLLALGRWFPFVLDGKAVAGYSRYFPCVNFLFLSGVITLVLIGVYWLGERLAKHPLLIPSRLLLAASYGFLLLSITTCVYSTDFLEISPGQQSLIWFGGTEDYVVYRIEDDSLTFLQDLRQNGGFLYGYGENEGVTVYLSATGFYGSLLKLGQSLTRLPPDDVLKGTRVLCAFLTAAFLTAVSLLLKKKFGVITSLVFSGFSLVTYWLMGPASHLIWFFPTLLIPLSISIFLYPRVMDGRLSLKRFLILSSVGYLLVFLRSYVYAPGMMLSGAIPVFFYEIYRRTNWKTILRRSIQVCLMGAAGFGVVMAVHFIQLWLYLGTAQEAADLLLFKATFRSFGDSTNLQTPLQIFQRWMNARVFYLPRHIFAVFPQWQAAFDQYNNFGNFHKFSLAAVVYAFILLIIDRFRADRRRMAPEKKNRLFALALTTPAAMLASWSWFPALGHMSHHYHMNGIMYLIPFGLTVFVLFGVLVEYSIQWVIKLR